MGDLREKLFEIQRSWLISARDRTGESLKNVLDLLMELTYVEPGQFILEFLQNAEDALMEAGRRGYFKVELYRDVVVISNNGKPFDEKDTDCLCSIRSSKIPSLGYKGFVGIGWKSVYKVSNHVEVYSGRLSFEFSEDYWSRSEAMSILTEHGLKPEKVLWQVTPIPIQPTEAVPENETRFIIHLKDESKYHDIVKSLDELGPSIFLFLDYVSKIVLVDHVGKRSRVIEWFTAGEEVFNGVRVKHVTVIVTENGSSTPYKFLVFKKEFAVPEDVKKDGVTIKAKRSDVVKREVAVAFSLHTTPIGEELKPIEEAKFWGMYSFLPLHEVRTGLRFLIQADFIVHPGRRYVNIEAKWNHWLMRCIADLTKIVIKHLQKHYKESYLSVLDYKYIDDEVFEKLIRPYIISTICQELSDAPVICVGGHEVKLSSVVKATEDVLQLIKYGLLDEGGLKYIYGVEKHILDPRVRLRERDSVSTLDIGSLLNENLIKAKLGKDLNKIISFLSEVYKLAYKRNVSIPPDNRFVLTSSKNVKLASKTYLPKLPPEVEKFSQEFPEVDNYLKTLNFVHEAFIEAVGVEILKWLGVREVGLEELVKNFILRQISVESKPPKADDLLVATTLVKRSEIEVVSPIWVLTRSGTIERSDNVWYPLKLFEGLEDTIKTLGIKLLDVDSYLKYDADVKGWERLFSKIVRGLELYTYHGYQCVVKGYVEDFINEVNKFLDKAPADVNIKLVRLLKHIYDSVYGCLKRIVLKLITDDDRFAYSNECILHDVYGPEERWFQWRSKGFQIGPFVSPKYLENPLEATSWRKFFVELLEVREKVNPDVVGKFAEWFAREKLISKGCKIVSHGGECDFKVDVEGNIVCVEVKGSRGGIEKFEADLSAERAFKLGESYWLIAVESIPDNPRAWLLKNPAKLMNIIKVSGKYIREYGELLK
jgi:hypothetical protein